MRTFGEHFFCCRIFVFARNSNFHGCQSQDKRKIISNSMFIKLSYGLLSCANFCIITLCQVRDPMPAVFFFLVDVSVNAVQTGATAAVCSAISQSLADLPVSFFCSAIYLWSLNYLLAALLQHTPIEEIQRIYPSSKQIN